MDTACGFPLGGSMSPDSVLTDGASPMVRRRVGRHGHGPAGAGRATAVALTGGTWRPAAELATV